MAMLACTGATALAPFPERPDTVVAGSLRGPFDGQVVDQATGNPISGALVLGTWEFAQTSALPTPLNSYSEATQTKNDGSYSLRRLRAESGAEAILRRFTLIVYKAGYIGYRSDLRYDDRTPRHDFSQRNNKVRLDRFPENESHARHLVFLGGGADVRKVALSEVVQASLELSEKTPATSTPDENAEKPAPSSETPEAPKPAPPPSTLASKLLPLADVQELAATGENGERSYQAEALDEGVGGNDMGPGFEAAHYRAAGRNESHDAALRLWRTGSGTGAQAVWKKLRAQLVNPQQRDAANGTGDVRMPVPARRPNPPLLPDVAAIAPTLRDGENGGVPVSLPARQAAAGKPLKVDGAFTAYDAKLRIYGVVVLVSQLGLVLELTCGADLCNNADAAVRLMARAVGRL